jgi:hypothetical protein
MNLTTVTLISPTSCVLLEKIVIAFADVAPSASLKADTTTSRVKYVKDAVLEQISQAWMVRYLVSIKQ